MCPWLFHQALSHPETAGRSKPCPNLDPANPTLLSSTHVSETLHRHLLYRRTVNLMSSDASAFISSVVPDQSSTTAMRKSHKCSACDSSFSRLAYLTLHSTVRKLIVVPLNSGRHRREALRMSVCSSVLKRMRQKSIVLLLLTDY